MNLRNIILKSFKSRRPKISLITIGLLVALLAVSQFKNIDPAQAQDKSLEVARSMSHVLDYLAKDYGQAVSEASKILNPSEFQEQLEFADQLSASIVLAPDWSTKPDFKEQLLKLKTLIQKKSPPSKVVTLARSLQLELLKNVNLDLSPKSWPSIEEGKQLFATNCTSCHGLTGNGDGPLAANMEPRPINFHDGPRMKLNSPFQVYNTIRLGINGTPMVAYTSLKDEEVWALAFYVLSIRHQSDAFNALDSGTEQKSDPILENLNSRPEMLERISRSSDSELADGAHGAPLSEYEIQKIRSFQSAAEGKPQFAHHFVMLRKNIDESLSYLKLNEFEKSKIPLLNAYLDGFEPVEPALKAFQPQAISQMETLFSRARQALDKKNVNLAEEAMTDILSFGDQLENQLLQNKTTPLVTAVSVFTILFREGFEAFLIVLVILSILTASGAHRAKKWIHSGWLLAVASGFLLWNLSQWVVSLSGLSREAIEGIASLFAVVILIFVGIWLHRNSVAKEWQSLIKGRIDRLLNKDGIWSLFGLSFLAFIAVFREVLETVIFLRAASPTEQTAPAVLWGALAAMIVLAICFGILSQSSKKLPIQKIFKFSGFLIIALSVILTGQGLHALQECGWISITQIPLGFLHAEWAGIFPTLETFGAQVILLGFLLALTKKTTRQATAVRA